jgi:MFS family permease
MTAAAVEGKISGGSNLRVIAGASAGTVFEWYDFYLYGSLATFITEHFFSGVNATTGYIFALLAFAAGFAVRPFGALVFGRLGDLWGRKNTFLVTMMLMGLSTFVVGLLPGYDQIGVAAPVLLIVMRLIQGWRWAASTAERPPTSPSMRRRASAGSTPAGSRPRRRWACSSA